MSTGWSISKVTEVVTALQQQESVPHVENTFDFQPSTTYRFCKCLSTMNMQQQHARNIEHHVTVGTHQNILSQKSYNSNKFIWSCCLIASYLCSLLEYLSSFLSLSLPQNWTSKNFCQQHARLQVHCRIFFIRSSFLLHSTRAITHAVHLHSYITRHFF